MGAEEELNSFSDVDDLAQEERGRLIDLNTERIQLGRSTIHLINRIRDIFNAQQQDLSDRFNDACDQIVEAQAVGARLSADLTADIIMDEFGLEELVGSDDGDEEDES